MRANGLGNRHRLASHMLACLDWLGRETLAEEQLIHSLSHRHDGTVPLE